MLISVLKSKLAYVKITQLDLFYEGSITIDSEWMAQANIRENEQVQVVNINNGERLITYAIPGKAGSGIIGLNGAAARKGALGDELLIISYATIDPDQESINPIVINMKDS